MAWLVFPSFSVTVTPTRGLASMLKDEEAMGLELDGI
jgi:hypothetical protein